MRTLTHFIAMSIFSIPFVTHAEGNSSEKSMTVGGYEIAIAKANAMLAERRKFDTIHVLKGKNAELALRQMEYEGYKCSVGYLDLPRLSENSLNFEFIRTPLVFCSQKSLDSNDICAERRVNLSIAWQNSKGTEAEIYAQLPRSVVLYNTFRCVETSEIGR